MERAIIVRGRLIDSRHIELDEPVDELQGNVEVTLRSVTEQEQPRQDTKEDIDAQLAEERGSWDKR